MHTGYVLLLYFSLPYKVSYTLNPKYCEMNRMLCSFRGAHGSYQLHHWDELGIM